MLTIYIIGFILYCISVAFVYATGFKGSSWYIPIGLIISIAINYLWFYISKNTIDKNILYLRGIYWDSMIVFCYIIIPILMYGVRFKATTAIGICLIMVGMILTKL